MRTGAECTIEALKDAGVKTIFGLPGGTVLDLFDQLARAPFEFFLVRHEPIWLMAMPAQQESPVAVS